MMNVTCRQSLWYRPAVRRNPFQGAIAAGASAAWRSCACGDAPVRFALIPEESSTHFVDLPTRGHCFHRLFGNIVAI